MAYTVKVVSKLAGVSVRTLHYYDEIDLLQPSDTTDAGYRIYSNADLERLQQILFFKELGFDLREIKKIMDHPGYDRKEAMFSHRQILVEKKKRLEGLINLVDQTIQTMERGITMEKKDMFAGFDEAKIEAYKKEAREKYDKATVEECEKRTAGYTKSDWESVQQEMGQVTQKIAEQMEKGVDDVEVQKLIGEFHQYINDNFYTCTLEIFSGLAELYITDERFEAYYEQIKPGLARFMHDAMKIYCANQ